MSIQTNAEFRRFRISTEPFSSVTQSARNEIRKKIERQTKHFLSNGGIIEKLTGKDTNVNWMRPGLNTTVITKQ